MTRFLRGETTNLQVIQNQYISTVWCLITIVARTESFPGVPWLGFICNCTRLLNELPKCTFMIISAVSLEKHRSLIAAALRFIKQRFFPTDKILVKLFYQKWKYREFHDATKLSFNITYISEKSSLADFDIFIIEFKTKILHVNRKTLASYARKKQISRTTAMKIFLYLWGKFINILMSVKWMFHTFIACTSIQHIFFITIFYLSETFRLIFMLSEIFKSITL